jgi:hypothetical protein
MTDFAAPVTGKATVALEEWSSLWADLLHVDMVLSARRGLPDDAAHIFGRRGLWEAAVIAYGRTATTGRRQQQVQQLLGLLGPDAENCHREVLAWRNRYAAHRADPSRETVEVRAILDPEGRRVIRLNVRVAPTLGPEEEDDALADRFEKHVKNARDLVWTSRIQPLERRVIEEEAGDIDALLRVATPLAPAATEFAIDINPSDGDTGVDDTASRTGGTAADPH